MMGEDWQSTEELLNQLDRLTGKEWQKKRDTVLAMVDARLAGRSEETVWPLPQTCNRSTYHSKWKKRDPIFVDVLEQCTRIARRHQDAKPARAVMQAGQRLQLASPAAAGRLIALLNSEDESIILRAAKEILDRAGIDTAPKGETHQVTGSIDEWRQQAEQRRRQVEEMLAAFDAAGPPDEQTTAAGAALEEANE